MHFIFYLMTQYKMGGFMGFGQHDAYEEYLQALANKFTFTLPLKKEQLDNNDLHMCAICAQGRS